MTSALFLFLRLGLVLDFGLDLYPDVCLGLGWGLGLWGDLASAVCLCLHCDTHRILKNGAERKNTSYPRTFFVSPNRTSTYRGQIAFSLRQQITQFCSLGM